MRGQGVDARSRRKAFRLRSVDERLPCASSTRRDLFRAARCRPRRVERNDLRSITTHEFDGSAPPSVRLGLSGLRCYRAQQRTRAARPDVQAASGVRPRGGRIVRDTAQPALCWDAAAPPLLHGRIRAPAVGARHRSDDGCPHAGREDQVAGRRECVMDRAWACVAVRLSAALARGREMALTPAQASGRRRQ